MGTTIAGKINEMIGSKYDVLSSDIIFRLLQMI